MKKYFITGLVLLLPLALTLIIVMFVFNLLTAPFVGFIKALFGNFLSGHPQIQRFISQVLILILLFFFTVFLGAITRWFFVKYLLKLTDSLFHRIPLISTIYKTSQDVINTLFKTQTKSFKQVVLVPFPNKDTFSLGLVTRDDLKGLNGTHLKDEGIAVFVPTTPNPTSGFLMLFKQSEIIYLDMSIEDALKYTISCGVILSPFKELDKGKVQEKMDENR